MQICILINSDQIALMLKTLLSIGFQTGFGYWTLTTIVQNERFENIRFYIEEEYGETTLAFLYGSVLFLAFPCLVILENFLFAYAMNVIAVLPTVTATVEFTGAFISTSKIRIEIF